MRSKRLLNSQFMKEILALLALSLLSACSPRDYLSRRLAADLIASSPEFNQPQPVVLKTGIVSNQDYLSPEFLVLQRHGWVTANSAKCPPNLEPAPCWDVSLTPAGVDTVRLLVHNDQASKPAIAVPAARRELVAVSGISKQGTSADVEFTWHWVPANEIGAAFYADDQHYRSLVGFRKFDDGWRIVQSAAHSGQSIDDALKSSEPISP